MEIDKVAVIGAGSWGTALASLLSAKGLGVRLYCRRKELADEINSRHENPGYLPDVKLPAALVADSGLDFVLEGAQAVVFVIPSQFARPALVDLKARLAPGVIAVCATKGVEEGSLLTMSELFAETLGPANPFAYIGGPSFAAEVARGFPTAVTVGSENMHTAMAVQSFFSTRNFRVYLSNDVAGLQLGGVLKNVIAIAAGIADGLGFGHNARAALITRGLAEMIRLGTAMGARQETFYGLSGIGDLLLTATGSLSRNRTVGFKIGLGMKLAEVLAEMNMIAEGVTTSRSAYRLARKFDLYMPIVRETYLILHEDKNPLDAVNDLLGSEAGSESGESNFG